MKYTIHQIQDGEDELILNYQKATEEVEAVLVFMEKQQKFDEADKLGKREVIGIAGCTLIYTAVSYLCGWFDRNPYVTIGFAGYVVFLYFCVFLVYKCRRKIDDKILNYDLELFKTKSK